jgi:hypothetical protein
LIPIEAFQAAKGKSILDYCERNRIHLDRQADGRSFIKERDTLEVTAHAWINHKNKTRGNVIDFVANHQRVSLLNAVSQLTGNPKLLLLEQYVGAETSRYRPFVLPEKDSATRAESLLALSHLLGRQTPKDGFAHLFKQQRLHVSSSRVIRFFSEHNGGQHTEYFPDSTGRYQQRPTGAKTPFYSRLKGKREVELFPDPKALLSHRPDAFEKDRRAQSGVLALLEPNVEAVHRAIAPCHNLGRITMIGDPNGRPETLKFFDELKTSLNPFSIDVALAWEPLSRQREAGHGRERELSLFQGG